MSWGRMAGARGAGPFGAPRLTEARDAPLISESSFPVASRMRSSARRSNPAHMNMRQSGTRTLFGRGPVLAASVKAHCWGPHIGGGTGKGREAAFARLYATRGSTSKTAAEQGANMATELGAQQALYEALNAEQLSFILRARRDLIWAATEQCGLGDVPLKRPVAPADAATVAQAAQRNDMLRGQGISIPRDHVTEWEVAHFWREERGLEEGSPYFKQLMKAAANRRAGKCHDVPSLRQLTAAFDDAVERHPKLNLDINSLFSSSAIFLCSPDNGTVEERAEAFMCNAETLQAVIAGESDTFSLYSCSTTLLLLSREKLVQRVKDITEVLHSVGHSWGDMPPGSWFGTWISREPETLKANTANLAYHFSAEALPRMVQRNPSVVVYSPKRVEASIQALAAALVVSRKDAVLIMSRHASIFRAAPGTITDAVATLASIPELGSAVALELCMQTPSTAGMKTESILKKWHSLQIVTAMKPEWRAEFVSWPSNIARLANVLARPLVVHQRLRYLADCEECSERLAAARGAYTWLRLTPDRFDTLCPGFYEWLSKDSVK